MNFLREEKESHTDYNKRIQSQIKQRIDAISKTIPKDDDTINAPPEDLLESLKILAPKIVCTDLDNFKNSQGVG